MIGGVSALPSWIRKKNNRQLEGVRKKDSERKSNH